MFDFLFKYSPTVFSKGQVVLLGAWPHWLLALAVLGAGFGLAWPIWRQRAGIAPNLRGVRSGLIWGLQTIMVALLLLLLWQPALSVATLKPQQNIVAIVVDDSRSMAVTEHGSTRKDAATRVLNGGLISELQKRFQVRLYSLGDGLKRIDKPEQLTAAADATRLGANLKQVVAESSSLPIGAVVLLSDGADNSGGIDLETISEVRRQRIPVHTIGFGREKFDRDIEVTDVQAPERALPDTRIGAQVTLHQRGYAGTKARLAVRDGGKVLTSREVALKGDGIQQTETLVFDTGNAGVKNLQVSVEPLPGEENVKNNSITRLVNVENTKPRILYVEGEPRWEYKFLRRALEDDRSLQIVSMLRTTQNKIYRQGVGNPKELEDGFPTRVEDLFNYQALIIGSVEAGYFTSTQQELIKQFVDRRGGGVLFLAGRMGLSDGGYLHTPFADLLPVELPDRKKTFVRENTKVELANAGRDSLICRLEENPEKNAERWKNLPPLEDYQEVGSPKPGAVVLLESLPAGRGRLPLLVTQNYGRGRSAVFATAGSWRWHMLVERTDHSQQMFWQQLLRWLADTRGHVVSSTPRAVLSDDTGLHLRTEVRDRTYLPMADAKVEAHVIGPEGLAEAAELRPDPVTPGVYTADYTAGRAGAYMVEIVATRGQEEIGRDVVMVRREDGVAENFHAEQNRELLEKLSSQTGGRYYRPEEWKKLAGEISYSEAGITVRETRDLWDMPIVFLLVVMLWASEWLLRRKWGVV